MGQNSRTSKVLALSLGQTLTTLVSVISGIVLARLLTKQDYATFRQTFLAYNFIAPLLMLGLPSALYYFLPRHSKRQRGVTMDNLLLLAGLALILSLFLSFGGTELLAKRFNNPALSETLRWMIGYPLYVMPVGILGAVLVTKEKVRLLTVYNVVTKLILITGTIIAVVYTQTYQAPLLVQIFLPLIFCGIALYLVFKNLPKDNWKPKLDSMKSMLKFSAPLGIASLMGTIMLQLDKVIVSVMCTPTEFANYVNGAIEIPLIGVITGSIATIILAEMSKMCYENNKEQALILFKKATLRSAAILLPTMVFLLLTAKPFILTLYSDKYLESIVPFTIYLFVLPIRVISYGSVLMALGQTKVILIRSIFDLVVNVILSITFVYIFGYIGAAVATLITLYMWTVPFNLYHIAKGFNVSFFNTLPFKNLSIILGISVLGLCTGVLYKLFNGINVVFQLIIAGLFYFPVVIFMLYKKDFLPILDKFKDKLSRFL